MARFSSFALRARHSCGISLRFWSAVVSPKIESCIWNWKVSDVLLTGWLLHCCELHLLSLQQCLLWLVCSVWLKDRAPVCRCSIPMAKKKKAKNNHHHKHRARKSRLPTKSKKSKKRRAPTTTSTSSSSSSSSSGSTSQSSSSSSTSSKSLITPVDNRQTCYRPWTTSGPVYIGEVFQDPKDGAITRVVRTGNGSRLNDSLKEVQQKWERQHIAVESYLVAFALIIVALLVPLFACL